MTYAPTFCGSTIGAADKLETRLPHHLFLINSLEPFFSAANGGLGVVGPLAHLLKHANLFKLLLKTFKRSIECLFVLNLDGNVTFSHGVFCF